MPDDQVYGYCEVGDLLIGDLILPEEIDKGKYIEAAADEMDARIGLLYQTPVRIDPDKYEQYKPTITFLKSINARLASGRILMAAATVMELNVVHAYARNLVDGAQDDLNDIKERKYILQGAQPNGNPPESYVASRGYSYVQDPVSAVDSFYDLVDPRYGTNKGAFMNPLGVAPW